MSKKIILILLIGMVFLTGCNLNEKKVPIEGIDMVGILGFDYEGEGTYKLTAAIPQKSKYANERTQIYTTTTELVTTGMVDIEKKTEKKVVLNQLRVILFSEEFATSGKVEEVIKHLYRNTQVGNEVLLAIVKGSAEELMRQDYTDKASVINYVSDLLQPSVNLAFNPNTNIHDLMYTQTNPNIDSIMPVIELKGKKLELTGVALFKGDHMENVLHPDDALYIQAIQGKKKLSPFTLNVGGGDTLLLDFIDNSVKIISNKSLESPRLKIILKIEGTMSEYKGKNISFKDPEIMERLEKDAEKDLKKKINDFLEEMQKLEVDPIGLTENVRRHQRVKWDTELTRKTISKMKWDIEVDMSILSTGVLH
ncbi:Ger(x)C family spore germination protein [Psychrobacillus sp. BL-248-WT-3]|uniref:Ger(x)C family spore germination protein n=1 Tax=Psychrobacillus sp. BL-248-WT-3 TaxID=2725306 RepID=UPI00146D3DF7|nr:Ger(x)C family spore germination protein [Psychrobacillus sp. BL-248-WT-3]NME05355.1 Ger(x)C family spore germination protein [Psychrobacillus sp. BL-248-WT-3]